jgi:glucosamine-phosphate N-acetyltransferase
MVQIFRRLCSSDYLEYLRLINEFRQTHFTEEEFIKTLTLIEKSSTIWVLEEDNHLLATGTIIYEHKFIFDICIYAHIEDVCVTKELRRQGLGKKLIEHLLEQTTHCYKVTLDCADENVAFYLACGLEKRGNQMCQLISNLKK